MEKKCITKGQDLEIFYLKENLKAYTIKELKENKEIEQFYKDYKSSYETEITKEQFIEYFAVTILEGKEQFQETILKGYTEYEIDQEQRVYNFLENLEDKETEDLIKFLNDDEDLFKANDYLNTDFVMEDFTLNIFLFDNEKDFNKYTYYCSSYMGELFIKINEVDSLEQYFSEELEQEEDLQEIKDRISDFIYEADLRNIFNIFLVEKESKRVFGYENYDYYKAINEEKEKGKVEVKQELNKRLNKLQKENKEREIKIKELNKLLKTEKNDLIKESLKDKLEKEESSLRFDKQEIEDIKEVLK